MEGDLTPQDGSPADPVGDPQYFLRPSVEPFVDRRGTLCFVRPGGDDLVVREPDPADIALVRLLREGRETTGVLAGRLGLGPGEVQQKLDSLVAAGLVVSRDAGGSEAMDGEDLERFSRQLPYLAESGDEMLAQRRLREAKVVVIGCGGIGTWAIAALAGLGVGRFALVDDDSIELSNLNRQILYARDDVGTPKVQAAAAWIRAFDPAIAVSVFERRLASQRDVAQVIDEADAVVLAADWPPYEIARWVNAACVVGRVPFITAGQVPPILKVGPTYMPGSGPCFACHEAALARESSSYQDYAATRLAEPATASTLGAASAIAGGMIGLELMHLVTGRVPVTRDLALIIDIASLDVRRATVTRDVSCHVCQHLWDGRAGQR